MLENNNGFYYKYFLLCIVMLLTGCEIKPSAITMQRPIQLQARQVKTEFSGTNYVLCHACVKPSATNVQSTFIEAN